MLKALRNLFMVSNNPDVMMIVLASIIFLLFIGIVVASMNRKSSEPFEHKNEEHEHEEHEHKEHEHKEHEHREHVAHNLELAVLKTRDYINNNGNNLHGEEVSNQLQSAVKAVVDLYGHENLEQHLDAAMDKHNIPHKLIDPIVLGHTH